MPDTVDNVAEFGYAGSGDNRSAYPKARVVALAECGTHAFVAAEVDACTVGEKTLAHRLYPRLRGDELLTADRNFYSFDAWGLAARSGAALLWRALLSQIADLLNPPRLWDTLYGLLTADEAMVLERLLDITDGDWVSVLERLLRGGPRSQTRWDMVLALPAGAVDRSA